MFLDHPGAQKKIFLTRIMINTQVLMRIEIRNLVTFWQIFTRFTLAVTLLTFSLPVMTQTSRTSRNISIYHRDYFKNQDDFCAKNAFMKSIPMLMMKEDRNSVTCWHIITWSTIAVTLLNFILAAMAQATKTFGNISIYNWNNLEDQEGY